MYRSAPLRRHRTLLHKLHFRITSNWGHVGADEAFVTVWSDGSDTEYMVIDREVAEYVLGHISDQLLVLPIVCPRVAPVDAIGNSSGRTVPAEVRIVA